MSEFFDASLLVGKTDGMDGEEIKELNLSLGIPTSEGLGLPDNAHSADDFHQLGVSATIEALRIRLGEKKLAHGDFEDEKK